MLKCSCKMKEDEMMKYDCSKEFDLNEIYRKLTSTSAPTLVKASEFFVDEGDDDMYRLQALAEKMIALSDQTRVG